MKIFRFVSIFFVLSFASAQAREFPGGDFRYACQTLTFSKCGDIRTSASLVLKIKDEEGKFSVFSGATRPIQQSEIGGGAYCKALVSELSKIVENSGGVLNLSVEKVNDRLEILHIDDFQDVVLRRWDSQTEASREISSNRFYSQRICL